MTGRMVEFDAAEDDTFVPAEKVAAMERELRAASRPSVYDLYLSLDHAQVLRGQPP